MTARFTPARGLDEKVAELIAGAMSALARTAADSAAAHAPPDKVWATHEDERVRPEHEEASQQAVPDNLRFTLRAPAYDQQHYSSGPWQLGKAPRDEEGFTPGNTANCRCEAFLGPEPGGLARGIHAHPARVTGTRVAAGATCEHHLAENAEFGNSTDHGARFMAAGLRAAASAARPRARAT